MEKTDYMKRNLQWLVWYERDTAASVHCFWYLGHFFLPLMNWNGAEWSILSPPNEVMLHGGSYAKCKINKTSEGIWYILCLNGQNRDYSREDNVHFLQHDNNEADFPKIHSAKWIEMQSIQV